MAVFAAMKYDYCRRIHIRFLDDGCDCECCDCFLGNMHVALVRPSVEEEDGAKPPSVSRLGIRRRALRHRFLLCHVVVVCFALCFGFRTLTLATDHLAISRDVLVDRHRSVCCSCRCYRCRCCFGHHLWFPCDAHDHA